MADLPLRYRLSRLVRRSGPYALIALLVRSGADRRQRAVAGGALLALWTAVYARYRRQGRAWTAQDFELMATATPEAYSRHYNEEMPTVEEELADWGLYHQHRHAMRYDLVAAEADRHLVDGGVLLDIGCGSALVAERLADRDARYVGLDFGGHHVEVAAAKFRDAHQTLRTSMVRGDGEHLPLADASVDVVVFTEVIEHLMRPELSVWEIARVLKPGGVLVMTTNNASEMPLHSPASHLFAWVEKAAGATWPALISYRPWVWPQPISAHLAPASAGPVHLPHTWHIQGQTRAMFAAAGLRTERWSTFEFPPPQSATARTLESWGDSGRKTVDLIEAIATRTPGLRRLGCHLFMVARKEGAGTAAPPPGIWPGPFSA